MAHTTDDRTDELLGRFLSAEAGRLAGQAITAERMTARVRTAAAVPRRIKAPMLLLAATLTVAGLIGGLFVAGGRIDNDRGVTALSTPTAVALLPTPTPTSATPSPSPSPTPTRQPPTVNEPAGLHPRLTPADVEGLVLAEITADEQRLGWSLATPRVISIDLVPAGQRWEDFSYDELYWAVTADGTDVNCLAGCWSSPAASTSS